MVMVLSECTDNRDVFPAEAVTFQPIPMPSGYLSPSSEDRIRQVSVASFDASACLVLKLLQ